MTVTVTEVAKTEIYMWTSICFVVIQLILYLLIVFDVILLIAIAAAVITITF